MLWEDVCFNTGVIRICRMQERDGSITALTKTEAGTREIPMGPVLKAMLLEWRLTRPRLKGELHRVFPEPGRVEKDGKRIGVGLVAKLAGHANASITLSRYTQAVRNGDVALKALEIRRAHV